jgi:fructokinase
VIVVVGEALIDIVEGEGGKHEELVGGGPLNIAVGLSRLDHPALLITQTGHDAYGEEIAAYLHGNDVELITGPTTTRRTNTATATLAADGSATYAFDLEWTLQHQTLPACDVLHVGSLGTALEPGSHTVSDLVEQAYARDVFVSFDPNLRAQFLGDPEQAWGDVQSLADRAGLVKMSDEDVALLHPGADPADIARSLLGGDRTELVVVTHGAQGAAAYTSRAEARVDAPKVTTVDTVGAGDSFMSALLAILLDDGSLESYGEGLPHDEAALERLLRGAAQAAAVTCSRRGANPPTRAELPDGWPGSPG